MHKTLEASEIGLNVEMGQMSIPKSCKPRPRSSSLQKRTASVQKEEEEERKVSKTHENLHKGRLYDRWLKYLYRS